MKVTQLEHVTHTEDAITNLKLLVLSLGRGKAN